MSNVTLLYAIIHCVKRVRIRSFSGPYFPAFEYLSILSPNETRKTPNTDTFYAVILMMTKLNLSLLLCKKALNFEFRGSSPNNFP